MTNRIAAFFVAVTVATGVAFASNDEVPDLSEFDRDTLQMLCEKLYERITALEKENAEIKAHIALLLGGSGNPASVATQGASVVVNEGSWVVTILSNPEPDTSNWERQVAEERDRRASINPRLDAARAKLTEMQSAKTSYKEDGKQKFRNTYSNRDLIEPRRQVSQLEGQRGGIDLKIRDLERRIEIARTRRTITARMGDGKPVTILARGAAAAVGATLQPGQRYTVTGRGNFSDTSGEILLRAAAAMGGE